MAITVLMKKKVLQKTITVMTVLAIGLLLFGLWLKLNDSPDAKVTLITGGVFLLFAVINKWWLRFSRK